jgi:hypothetical protein
MARKIALAETARLFSRATQRSLQKQNSEHVSTSRLLAAQLALESGKRAALGSKATPNPASAVRFRPLHLVNSSSQNHTDLAAGLIRSTPGTSNPSAGTARHCGQPTDRARPRPFQPSTTNASISPNPSISTAPVSTSRHHDTSDSGGFTPTSPSVSPPPGPPTQIGTVQTVIPPRGMVPRGDGCFTPHSPSVSPPAGPPTRVNTVQTTIPPPAPGRQDIPTPPTRSTSLRRPLVRFSLVMPAQLGMRHKEALYISHGPPEPVVDLPWVGSGELRRQNTSRPAQRSFDSD